MQQQNTDQGNGSNGPKYELWFRNVYTPALKARAFNTALRPGDRRHPAPKGTRVGEEIMLRALERPGIEELEIQPRFNCFQAPARITNIVVKRLGDLTHEDLQNCSEDARDPLAARYHLGLHYNKHFGDDELVSIISWEY